MAGGQDRATDSGRRRPARRAPEDAWARWVAIGVGLLGLVIVVLPALLHVGELFGDDLLGDRTRSETVVRVVDGQATTETTTKPDDLSAVEQVLSGGGFLLLRIGFVALAAFGAGAIVQRIGAADFSGKFGPVELQAVSRGARASSASLEAVAKRMEAQMLVTRKAVKLSTDAARQVRDLEARTRQLEQERQVGEA